MVWICVGTMSGFCTRRFALTSGQPSRQLASIQRGLLSSAPARAKVAGASSVPAVCGFCGHASNKGANNDDCGRDDDDIRLVHHIPPSFSGTGRLCRRVITNKRFAGNRAAHQLPLDRPASVGHSSKLHSVPPRVRQLELASVGAELRTY
jgi:hypothetical protein